MSAVDQLRRVIEKVSSDGEIQQIIQARDTVYQRYQPIFSQEHIQNLTKDEFLSFLDSKNNRHWSNLTRQSGKITSNMQNLRDALGILLEESVPLKERLDQISSSGQNKVPGLGRAVITPILLISHPDKYGVWNSTSEAGMKTLGVWPSLDSKTSFGESYQKINDVLVGLARDLDIDLWALDALWWRMVPNSDKKLGSPFNLIFRDYDQASYAFDIFEFVFSKLGITNIDDPMIVMTASKSIKKAEMHLTYGNWYILGLAGAEGNINRLNITLNNGENPFPATYEGDFYVRPDETRMTYYSLPMADVAVFENDIKPVFSRSLDAIKKHFANWRKSSNHNSHVIQLAEGVLDKDIRKSLLSDGLSEDIIRRSPPPEGTIRYWKIAPGENAWDWERCLSEGIIAIGWDELGDLSGMTRDDFEQRRDTILTDYPDWSKSGVEQVWDFYNINPGDKILANKGKKEILGFGTITGPYSFKPGQRQGHQLPVNWEDTRVRNVSEGSWVSTLRELTKEKFEQLFGSSINPVITTGDSLFTDRAFELLEGIHANPTMKYYQEHKDEFKVLIEQPIQQLTNRVAAQLPQVILGFMETQKNIYSRFNKNDFGQGGAWPHYWSAFYPKGSKRTADAQLSIGINYEGLSLGFSIADYAVNVRERFRINAHKYGQTLITWLDRPIQGHKLEMYRKVHDSTGTWQSLPTREPITWKQWFEDPDSAGYSTDILIKPGDIHHYSLQTLESLILDAYTILFPLVLLASKENPMQEIQSYLTLIQGEAPDISIQPVYSMNDFIADTGFDLETANRWVRSIHRKGQAIIYGPPGTGKTYTAQALAKYLIGGANGFSELVQFHPAYSYEDFMQGIRPKRTENGLDYPLVSGRFLDFCNKAKERSGCCVLIIDEINRANLSRVFGELLYLLEYRDEIIPLSGGGSFTIPKNIRLIGTMNTADRSIALVDHALRRRFAFLALYPNYDILHRYTVDHNPDFPVDNLIQILRRLNEEYIQNEHYFIGISYFLRENLFTEIGDIWQMEIFPYLEEYFFDVPASAAEFSWSKIRIQLGL